ncbi:hypothetical protein [Bdellovibrio sp. HCB2-146]|uniref:hypothetical protein n=1 Tax=Bdellovibrio sp. HCB2-146 TaxID=3394362 RepID=UPI0039BD5361
MCGADFCKDDLVLFGESTIADVKAIYTTNAGYSDDVKVAIRERGINFNRVVPPEEISVQVRCNENESLCRGDYAGVRGTLFRKVKILNLFKNNLANVIDSDGRKFIISLERLKW